MTPPISRRGILFALSSPSGAGKTSIARGLIASVEALSHSVSYTTRPIRPGEVDGKDYHFVDQETFNSMVSGGHFLEHAYVFGNYYGTPKAPVLDRLQQGGDLVFDIDWQGFQQIKQHKNQDVVSIFILPPNKKALQQRLISRGQDSASVISRRMQRAAQEMSHWIEYDYIIINTILADAIQAAVNIVHAERMKRWRHIGLVPFVQGISDPPDH
ncbi:MAG: guanylate kinase [Alphaproteobacteria bacterium]|nr:MAG: guanylate kinase [Alphaproteobacteria bacterium]